MLLELTSHLPPSIFRTEAKKRVAFNQAKRLAKNKGIINLGAGIHRQPFAYSTAHSPEVKLNVDITPDGVSNFLQLDLEQTPYPFSDKQFDVCFASHVLEHLDNWEEALNEMVRIADYVIIAIPHPLDFFACLNSNHKQHFSFSKIRSISNLPNIFVHY